MILKDTVAKFLDRAAELHGKVQRDRFEGSMYFDCGCDSTMQSPIEHLFWIAAAAQCESQGVPFHGYHGKHPRSERGIYVDRQFQVDRYRVDFRLEQVGIGPEEHYTPLIVELDGHDFHDKNKQQRSYEKERDRVLIRHAYKVLHFTGSDVVADPFRVSYEVLSMLGVFVGNGVPETYNPRDPLVQGWGL